MFATSAGGAAGNSPTEESAKIRMFKLEMNTAKSASNAAGAAYRMLLSHPLPLVDLEALADAADEAALRAGRLAGFARLLARAQRGE